jgi:hypothetical protein
MAREKRLQASLVIQVALLARRLFIMARTKAGSSPAAPVRNDIAFFVGGEERSRGQGLTPEAGFPPVLTAISECQHVGSCGLCGCLWFQIEKAA